MPWHSRYLHFVLPQTNVFASWLSGNIELKSSDLLPQERNECSAFFVASFSVIERMNVDVSDFYHVCPGLFFLDLQLKMILIRLCTLLSKCQHLFEGKVYIDHQLTIYLGKMFYTLFLTSESNQQYIMAIAP